MNQSCPCGSQKTYSLCCGQYISGDADATTAELLMRSRYTAYCFANEKYLIDTWHPSTRPESLNLNKEDSLAKWVKLKINATTLGAELDNEGTVEFTARYKLKGKAHQLHETSQFSKVNDNWYYVGGIVSE